MGAPSLVSLCTKTVINNIRSLTDVGDCEYQQIRNILLKVTSPEQLRRIELSSPQIIGEDAELWKAFIARDISNWKSKSPPHEGHRDWYEVYQTYKTEQQEEIRRDEEILRQAMLGLQQKKQSNVATIMPAKLLPKVPRDPRMISNDGGVPISRKKRQAANAGSYQFDFSTRSSKAEGKNPMAKVRRQALTATARHRHAIPTADLGRSGTKISRVPKSMVNRDRDSEPVSIMHAPRRAKTSFNQQNRSRAQNSINPQVRPPSSLSPEEVERRRREKIRQNARVGQDSPRRTQKVQMESDDDIDSLFNEDNDQSAVTPIKSIEPKPLTTPTKSIKRSGLLAHTSGRVAAHESSRGTVSAPASSRSSPHPIHSAAQARRSPPKVLGEAPKGVIKRRRPEVNIFNMKKPRVQ